MELSFACASRFALALAAGFLVVGCEMLEPQLSPRTYKVNESSDAVLNNAILLNIVRAGYSEPLNFITIAKYTAGDQLTGGAAIGPFNFATLFSKPSTSTYGPASISNQVNNSFDLNTMDTQQFYQGMLQPLDPIALELWFRQGLPRALVFYLLLDSIRLSASDGVYEYKNDPADDRWTDPITGDRELTSDRCQPKFTGNKNQTNYDIDTSLWHGAHGEDCRFQKFRYFVQLAVKYGLRLETITVPGPAAKSAPTAIATPNAVQATTPNAATSPTASTGGPAAAAPASTPTKKTQICYDLAVLRDVEVPSRFLPQFTACGRNTLSTRNEITLGGIGTFRDTQLVMRSGFGIFQYLGRVFATGSDNLTLGSREYDVTTRSDDRLLTLVPNGGPSCFASAWYRSSFYCVPNAGAENTKLIFTILRAIVATNISALLLNSTPTVRVTP
ncbi:MAG TPA: hypothetical protein VK591_07365 [Xanthobacteraceae bacterium]|nr:hypothetical protein [Xanthobacteraceae bacterium]